jgi:hypothetical protein
VRSVRFLLAVIFVAGQLGGAVHNLLVSHVVCLEHGEVIHSSAAPERQPASPHRGVAASPVRGHEHDVCLIALHRRERVAQTAPAVASAPAPADRSPIALAVVASAKSTRLFELAPKTSPPV